MSQAKRVIRNTVAMLLLTASSVWGAISVDLTTVADRSSPSTTVSTPAFSTASGNELLLALVATDYRSGANTTVQRVSGAGLTWTLVVRTNVQSGTAEIWRAFAVSRLTNVSVTATLSQMVRSSITVMSFSGVDTSGTNGSGSIGTIGSANARSGAPTATLRTTRNNSLVLGVGNDLDKAVARTPGTGQSLVHQYLSSVGDTYWVQRQNSLTPVSGTSVRINDTAPTTDRYNLSICEVLPAVSGGVQTWSISGTISPSAAGSGATVALSGTSSATVTAGSSGNYSFTGLGNGSYTVTPSKSGYTFSPASRAVTVNGANLTGINFTGATSVQTWSISGTISPSAAGSGATVALSGTSSATVTAGSSGNYSFTGLGNGSYTVTPSKSGFSFSPASQNVTVNGTNVSGLNFAVLTTPNFTVNGSQTFQTVDGMGVSINVNNWNGGQLKPALDLLVGTNGSSLIRVIRDPMDWVSSESLIPALHVLDPLTLQQVYEAPKMQDIWNTIGYLNQIGISGNQIMLTFMGWTPTWLGGSGAYGSPSYITIGKEPAFATMVASLVYYGRKVKNLNFTLLSPLNDSDSNCQEGPCVSVGQYGTVLDDLIAELNFMGLTDVRLVGPDTAGDPSAYLSVMMADSTIAGSVDHLGMHYYGGSPTPGIPYPPRRYWLTETAASCSSCDSSATIGDEWSFASQTNDYIIGDLASGFSSALVYDGYDSFYFRHNSWGFWGLVAYDQTTGVYAPRKRFYVNAQLNKFIRPGAVRIGVSSSLGTLSAVAFSNPTSGQVTIVGHNPGISAITINGQLQNLPTLDSLSMYQTNASVDLQRGTDIPVIGGAFSVTIPANTFFSLTALPAGGQTLVFDEEFNGLSLDTSVWVPMNRPGDASNNEQQCYTPKNATVVGGNLVITAKVDSSCAGYSYTSGMVQWKSYNFTYGTVEVRAKMAGGKGPWPAIWFLGANCQQTNVTSADNVPPCIWPNPGSDEIDMVEILSGNLTSVFQGIHSGGNNPGCTASTTDVSQNWHTYVLEWAPGSLKWKIDGVTTCTVTQSVPSTPMFMMINTAMGGNGGGTINNSTLPQTLVVDYVRVSK